MTKKQRNLDNMREFLEKREGVYFTRQELARRLNLSDKEALLATDAISDAGEVDKINICISKVKEVAYAWF